MDPVTLIVTALTEARPRRCRTGRRRPWRTPTPSPAGSCAASFP